MDDFNISSLTETRNEYSALLINKLTPYIIQGIFSIYEDACRLCEENDEHDKYLMTFQNFLSRVPKWNQEIVKNETQRILKQSQCSYLEDLITCVHVSQLKILTQIRVGSKQKKIDIDIPNLETFIHNIYIDLARNVYKNVFLFEKVPSLQRQKNMNELSSLVSRSILNVIRSSMPVENIVKSYLYETKEEFADEVKEEVREEVVEEPVDVSANTKIEPEVKKEETMVDVSRNEIPPKNVKDISGENISLKIDIPETPQSPNIRFDDNDHVLDFNKSETPRTIDNKKVEVVDAPKTIERLEEISYQRDQQRKLEEEEEEEEEKIRILDDDDGADLSLDSLGIETIDKNINTNKKVDVLLDDVIELK